MSSSLSFTDARLLIYFPNLRAGEFEKRSERSNLIEDYNCIAFAAHDRKRRWWPVDGSDYFWPNKDRGEELEVFVRAFSDLGYTTCLTHEYEEHFEKVAIYTKDGFVTHMSRQIIGGLWVSKLGPEEDIAHLNPNCLTGQGYGSPIHFMSRLHLGA